MEHTGVVLAGSAFLVFTLHHAHLGDFALQKAEINQRFKDIFPLLCFGQMIGQLTQPPEIVPLPFSISIWIGFKAAVMFCCQCAQAGENPLLESIALGFEIAKGRTEEN